MYWLFFSLLNSFFESVSNALGKRGAQKINVLSVVWAQSFFALFIIIPLALFNHSFQSFSSLNSVFWIATLLGCIGSVVTSILFIKAVKDSPLSVTVPITTFTPVFLLVTSPLIVGEFPKPLGVVGIFSVFIGSYILNLNKRVHGPLEPILAIFREKGSRYMFIVAFIWSITSNFDKIGVKNSSPLLYLSISTTLLLFFLTCVSAFKKISLRTVFKNINVLAPIGLATGLSIAFQMTAISMTLVANVISVKRTSALFSIVWGKVFFKEENISERFAGAAIMVVGVILITISS